METDEHEIVKIPDKTEGIVGAVIAGFLTGVTSVLVLLKIINKE